MPTINKLWTHTHTLSHTHTHKHTHTHTSIGRVVILLGLIYSHHIRGRVMMRRTCFYCLLTLDICTHFLLHDNGLACFSYAPCFFHHTTTCRDEMCAFAAFRFSYLNSFVLRLLSAAPNPFPDPRLVCFSNIFMCPLAC